MTIIVCQGCCGRGYICTKCSQPRARRILKKRWASDYPHQNCPRRPGGIKPCPGLNDKPHFDTFLRCDFGGETVPGSNNPNWGHSQRGHICPVCQQKKEVALDAIVGGLDFEAVGGQAIENLIAGLNRVDPRKLGLDFRRRLEEATLNFTRRCYQEELEAGMHKDQPPAVLFNGVLLTPVKP